MSSGIARNNPFNLEYNPHIPWREQIPPTDGTLYLSFVSPVMGIRAGMVDARTKVQLHGLNTLNKLLPVFAPKSENDVVAYIADVAARLAITPDDVLDINDLPFLIAYAKAIITHENGHCSTAPDWYADSVYVSAAALALAA